MTDRIEQRQIEAAVRLLTESDERIARRCREQVVQWGERARDAVEDAARDDDARLRIAARGVLRSLDLKHWTGEVRALGGRRDDDGLLGDGVELILSMGDPSHSRRSFSRRLDELVAGARARVAGRSPITAARILAEYLGTECGFRGCTKAYYRPENVFLDRVIERRRGLPIALVTLYLLVGRRAGLEVDAVRLPDYYLARVRGRRPTLLDPFHRGRSVTKADCLRYIRSVGNARPASSQLRIVDDLHVLLATLATLGRVYEHRGDREFREALQQAQRSLSLQ